MHRLGRRKLVTPLGSARCLRLDSIPRPPFCLWMFCKTERNHCLIFWLAERWFAGKATIFPFRPRPSKLVSNRGTNRCCSSRVCFRSRHSSSCRGPLGREVKRSCGQKRHRENVCELRLCLLTSWTGKSAAFGRVVGKLLRPMFGSKL